MSDDARLLTVVKPDGFARVCTPDEQRSTWAAWRDVLSWLNGADPDELGQASVVSRVAQKAALRMVRFPEYEITTWAIQARGLRADAPDAAGDRPMLELVEELLRSLDFAEEYQRRSWLNRVTIELLYGGAAIFYVNCDRLVPLLLDGPVVVQCWRGERLELALALKHTLRFSLARSQLSNLIHMEATTLDRYEMVQRSLQQEIEP